MREYRNRICSAVLAAVCVIGTALIPSRAVHAEDVVDPIAVQKQAAYDAGKQLMELIRLIIPDFYKIKKSSFSYSQNYRFHLLLLFLPEVENP